MLKKILLGLIGVICLGLLAFFIEFKDIILSNETPEQIEAKIGKNEEEFQAKIDEIINDGLDESGAGSAGEQLIEDESQESTDEDQNINNQEVNNQMLNNQNQNNQNQNNQTENKKQTSAIISKKTKKEIINEYKQKLTKIQGLYTSKINSMVGQAKAEYNKIPTDQKTVSKKVEIGLKYVDKALDLESESDGVVYSLIGDMERELTQNEYSTEIINIVEEYYEREKNIRKEYYKSKLNN